MKPPFYRACRKHREEIVDRTVGTGHEVLWCTAGTPERPRGHRIRSWLVLDGAGETLAVAFLNEAPKLVSSDLAVIDFPIPDPPEKFCKRGHFEWYLETDGRYRCRICKRDRVLRKYYDDRKKDKAKPKRVQRRFRVIAPFGRASKKPLTHSEIIARRKKNV